MGRTTETALFGVLALLGSAAARADADLAVDKTADQRMVVENRRIDYRVTVANLGPDSAEDVVLVDELPDQVQLTGADITCLPDTPSRLRCLLGNLPAGTLRTIDIEARAPSIPDLPLQQEVTLTNTVSVESGSFDPLLDNNGAFVNVTVFREEDATNLVLELFEFRNRFDTTNRVGFGMQVFNASTVGADEVTLLFRVPDLTLDRFISAVPTRGVCLTPLDTCTGAACDGVLSEPVAVTCNIGALPAGGTETVDVALATDGVDITALNAEGEVFSDRADFDLVDNRASVQTTLDDRPALQLEDSDGACALSVVAAGTPLERDLRHLRRVRDRLLRRTAVGARLVAAYYRRSPAFAAWLQAHPKSCRLVRCISKPVFRIGRYLSGRLA